MPKILLTNYMLMEFTGSVLVTLDLACEFINLGFEVTIATFSLTHIDSFNDIPVSWIDLNSIQPLHIEFDVIWSHHFPTLDTCLFDLDIRAKKIIFSSLSSFESLETPPIYASHLSLLLANSEETRDKIVSYDFPRELVSVFPNPVLSSYFLRPRRRGQSELQRIAIISNHVPDELLKASIMFRAMGITTDIYGVKHTYVQITADILLRYDIVITIGRTVQQCIVLGVLVYCYDHFGGPGYINLQNIQKAAYFNYSGRCSIKKTPNEVFAEVTERYSKAQTEFLEISDGWSNFYDLKIQVERVLCYLNTLPKLDIHQNGFFQLEKNKRVFFRCSNESKRCNYIQLFWMSEDDTYFHERNSIKRNLYINYEEKLIKFSFPKFDTDISYFRMDFIDCPAYIVIHELWLENHLGSILWQWNLQDDICNDKSPDVVLLDCNIMETCISMMSIGNDPYFTLNIDQNILKQITPDSKLVIRFFIKPLAEGVIVLLSKINILRTSISGLEDKLFDVDLINGNLHRNHQLQLHQLELEIIRAESQLELLRELLISDSSGLETL